MRIVRLLLPLTLCLVGWLMLAPGTLGGQTSYVTTFGNSMEPGFQAGDLAILRPADDYQVGDVVAYHSDTLDTVVMHRVLAIQDGTYSFQGDNNSWVDPDFPTRDQFVGRLVLRVPQGGRWLDRITHPFALALFSFGLVASGGSAVQRRQRRKRTAVARHVTRDQTRLGGCLPPWGPSALSALALAGVVGGVLAIPAWTTPHAASAAEERPAPAAMTFSYSTQVLRSAAYDDTTVTSPEPVFRTLADTVDVEYAYEGRPGSITVTAELSTASGWRSTVLLRPPTRFGGERHSGTVRLDLPALEKRAQAAARATGMPAGDTAVAVVAKVSGVDGSFFEPALNLNLTPLQLTVAAGSSLAVEEPPVAANDATQSPTGVVGIAGYELPVDVARTVSATLLLAALLGALALGLLAAATTRGGEGARIRRRYAPILIRVQPMAPPRGRPVVDVVDFATLAKLAQRYGLLVMHWSRSDVETFVVQDEGITYRYRGGTGGATAPADEPLESTDDSISTLLPAPSEADRNI